MTADLLALADWLAEHRVTRVGMESTSTYWKPVFYVLEERFDCWLQSGPGFSCPIGDIFVSCHTGEEADTCTG